MLNAEKLSRRLLPLNSVGLVLIIRLLLQILINVIGDDSMSNIQDNSEGAYFDMEGKFIPKLLADDIMQEIEVITVRDNQTMFYFDKNTGLWVSSGEVWIKEITQRKLDHFTKRYYIDEVLSFIKNSTLHNREIFDESPFLLPLENGILNINDMELYPFSSNYHFLSKLPVKYDANANCPNVKKFLEEIVPFEFVKLLLEVVGYCLYRNYSIQKAMMLIGDGENGKSTFLRLIENLIGKNNISSVSLTDLENNRFASSRLYGKYANIYADLPDQSLSQTGKFKMLTGGDNIEAEKKFQDSFNFTNHAKLIFSCNKLPMKNDDTNAFYRRWVIVKFPYSFEGKADKNLIQHISTPEELSGLLNMALGTLKELLLRGDFSFNKSTEEMREEYQRLSDPVGAFCHDMIESSPDEHIEKEKLYTEFAAYCREKNYIVISKDRFFKRIHDHVRIDDYRPLIDGKRVQCIKGIRVKGVNSVNQDSHLNPLEDSQTLLKYTCQPDTSDSPDITPSLTAKEGVVETSDLKCPSEP